MKIVYTIGHSTRSFDDLAVVLRHYNIGMLVDTRHFPRSRHNPQFNKELLEQELPKHDVEYEWIEELGGFRPGGYKKYVKTKQWQEGFEQLLKMAFSKVTAVMCAELLWFKCHRRYIADELKRSGFKVVHIYDEKKSEHHRITKRRKIKCD
jgi:uncharacterized protein (DUF488 family)